MALNESDAQALTYLAKRVRQDTYGAGEWDEAGIFAEVARLKGQDLALSIERVVRHAADPTAKTPGAIRRPFLPDAPKPTAAHPLRRDQECPAHPGNLATNCGGCAADRLAEDRPAPPPRAWDPGDAKAGADAARAALLAARGQTTEAGIA